ncbi:MAG: UDP-N-acetylenolpyruvoylglucosamine reductase [Elusimicrobia bacterium RIFOXYA2_FULL_39_19]|nr:MAG: UDP-N-acetylenolpyruvoylglucosamine reductase [Elusimicrobia bacterium RIFOXYA2_FULL_39_19]
MGNAIKEVFSGQGFEMKLDEPLAKHTTFKIGGPAPVYIEPKTHEELQNIVSACKANSFPFFIMGLGSNLLIDDKGFEGVVLHLRGIFIQTQALNQGNKVVIKAGAGVTLPLLIKKCADNFASGTECLAGIPGTVGGALIMNTGTKYGSISDKLSSVTVLKPDGGIIDLRKNELSFSYRHSSLAQYIVLSAEFLLDFAPNETIVKKITDYMLNRAETQPLSVPSAGSVFKNPPEKKAWQLIDACGLRGLKIGGAQISEKHANFIINTGNAKSSDVKELIETIQKKVKENTGIMLEPEIKIL